MSEFVYVKGMKELNDFLDTLAPKLQKNVMRGALRAGANVIAKEVKLRAPVAAPSAKNKRMHGGYAGALRDSIRVRTYGKGGKATARIIAGGKKRADVYYADWVEFGTSAHRIKAKKGGVLAFGGGVLQHVNHPGARAQPFMRPALDARAGDATEAVAQYVKARLEAKHGIDTSGVEIEQIEVEV